MASKGKPVSMNHPVVLTFLLFAIMAFMYFAAEVLKPLALAILLSFALVPISRFLENRGLPRVASVVLTVLLVLGSLGFVSYEVGQQLNNLANNLPKYEANINKKIAGMGSTQSSTITNVEKFVTDVSKQVAPKNSADVQEVRVVSEPNFLETGITALSPYLAGLGVGFIVLILLLYLMINREDMSDRMIRLFGRGKISLTTRTMEEVGQRISKYLMMFATVNTAVGVVVGLGLWAIGIPYALLWGFLAGALRFVPYAGPGTAFALPLLFSIASFEGWQKPLMVVGLFAVLELSANMVLEPVIYGKTTGVSALALLVAAMFWTWLWGALGLLLSTPLTVCLAVLGKYVPSLGFFATFLHEEVDLDPGVRYYQRLLAMDQDGATAVIDSALQKQPRAEVFDKVLIPCLSMAERDYARDDIDDREQTFIHRVTSDVIEDIEEEPEVDLATLATANNAAATQPPQIPKGSLDGGTEGPVAVKILALPANDKTDVLVLKMLNCLLQPDSRMIISEEAETPLRVVEQVGREDPALVLISHLPPDGLTAACYLVRRLRARHPRLKIVVGRWGEAAGAETSAERLTAVGATAVFHTLVEARDHLNDLISPNPDSKDQEIGSKARPLPIPAAANA